MPDQAFFHCQHYKSSLKGPSFRTGLLYKVRMMYVPEDYDTSIAIGEKELVIVLVPGDLVHLGRGGGGSRVTGNTAYRKNLASIEMAKKIGEIYNRRFVLAYDVILN